MNNKIVYHPGKRVSMFHTKFKELYGSKLGEIKSTNGIGRLFLRIKVANWALKKATEYLNESSKCE